LVDLDAKMADNQVPEHLREFISQCIGSVDELGMLLVLTISAARWWSAAAAGLELGIPERDARQILDRLASRNLLDLKIANDVRYRFRPGTADLERLTTELLTLYRNRPAVLLRCVPGVPGARLDDLARASRFKR
jgi:hypothetical protein